MNKYLILKSKMII